MSPPPKELGRLKSSGIRQGCVSSGVTAENMGPKCGEGRFVNEKAMCSRVNRVNPYLKLQRRMISVYLVQRSYKSPLL